MDQSTNNPDTEQVVEISDALAEVTKAEEFFRSEEKNRSLPFSFSLPTGNTLDDRLTSELHLVEFILSESKAAFKAPFHQFFSAGGQQLRFNQHERPYRPHSPRQEKD